MPWWYELRGQDNRLVELRRGFTTEVEAREAGERELAKIKAVTPKTEALTVSTGADSQRTKAAN